MTYEDIKRTYEPLQYLTSAGDNLLKISFFLYNSFSSRSLQALNRFNEIDDWLNIPAGTIIYYYPLSLISKVEECSFI